MALSSQDGGSVGSSGWHPTMLLATSGIGDLGGTEQRTADNTALMKPSVPLLPFPLTLQLVVWTGTAYISQAGTYSAPAS